MLYKFPQYLTALFEREESVRIKLIGAVGINEVRRVLFGDTELNILSPILKRQRVKVSFRFVFSLETKELTVNEVGGSGKNPIQFVVSKDTAEMPGAQKCFYMIFTDFIRIASRAIQMRVGSLKNMPLVESGIGFDVDDKAPMAVTLKDAVER